MKKVLIGLLIICGICIFAIPGQTATDKLLMETGDYILLETGDKILMETGVAVGKTLPPIIGGGIF